MSKTYLVQRSEKNAVNYIDSKYNYTELLQHIYLYSNHYTKIAPIQIERVMFFSENRPEYIFAIYGAIKLGAICIPVDVLSTSKELIYMMNDSRPEIIATTNEHKTFIEECVEKIEDYNPKIMAFEDVDVSDIKSQPVEDIVAPDEEKVITIIYTSGTTGSPKGVMLSFKNIWYNMDAVCNQVPIFRADSRTILILPLHHIFAFLGSMMAPLYSKGEVHINENLAPETILRVLKEGRITIMIAVPRLYEALAKGIMGKINSSFIIKSLYRLVSSIGSQRLAKTIFKSVHDKFGGHMTHMVCGGAALPLETGYTFKNLGFYILEGYGMTECSPMISFTRPGEWIVGTSGRALPGCEIMIGERDEVCVRGANVMKGYYNRPEETAQVIIDGWLHTGDTGVYDPDKGLKITGRIKEIIVASNGKNINPAEIENEVTQTSQVIKEMAVVLHEDILKAIVYPDMQALRTLTDSKYTTEELVKAEIESYNKGAMAYKRIMSIQIVSKEIPKNRLGKITRYKLEEFIADKEEVVKEDITNRSETFKILKSVLDEQTDKYANGDSHFEIDLALDSLGRVTLISHIEEVFGVSITEEQLSDLSTLNKLTEFIESNSNEIKEFDSNVSWSDILSSGEQNITLPKSGMLHNFIHNFANGLFSTLYNFKVTGKENIPEGATLFVANHSSAIDGMLVTSKMGWSRVHKTLFFAKDKHFQSSLKRFLARNNNIILMNINSNVRESMQQMYHVLKSGCNIVIFPEGTRSNSKELNDFKESFAILSKTLNIPVVPVAITGSGSESNSYKGADMPRIGSKINVKFLPAMQPSSEQSVTEFKDSVAKAISASL